MKCDFCGTIFEIEECNNGCKGCPMNKSCGKIKCPNCNYEMYQEPQHKMAKAIAKLFKFALGKKTESDTALQSVESDSMPLTLLKAKEQATIIEIDTDDTVKLRKLAAFGILPGNDIILVQKKPAIVISIGFTRVALDEEIASKIMMKKVEKILKEDKMVVREDERGSLWTKEP